MGGAGRGRLRVPPPVDLHSAERSAGRPRGRFAMTSNNIQRATIVASTPSSAPRLRLVPVRAGQAVLDGGWWPRSWDPVTELPGLILALDARFGPIRQVLLNGGA